MCFRSRFVKTRLASFARFAGAILFALFLLSGESRGAEPGPQPPAANQAAETNSPALLQLCLQLQEQLRTAQQAIEQNRQDTKAAAAHNEKTLSKGLEAIQAAFAAQRTRDWEAMQKANRTVFLAVGAVAAMGFLTLLLLGYFQWRTSNALAGISAALPAALGLGPGSGIVALGPAESSPVRLPGSVPQTEPQLAEPDRHFEPAVKPRKGPAMSIERRLFPRASDAFRRRQFRALKAALVVGLAFAAVVTLLICLVYSQHSP